MMTEQIRIGQVLDSLVTLARAREGYRGPDVWDDAPAVTVWDGPEFQTSEDHAAGGHLILGWPGSAGNPAPSGDTNWVAGAIARDVRARDETTRIVCMAAADSQSTPKEARDLVLQIVSTVADICRQNPSLGIDTSRTIGGTKLSAYVTAGSLTQLVHEGFSALMEFTVTYNSRV